MRRFLFLTTFWMFVILQAAVAGPVGVFNVDGTDPGSGNVYSGVVAIEKNGGTYTVVWDVGGTEYVGTAIGAASVKGSILFGEAAENDTALAVSYASGDSFGLALFVQQENGQWKGIWTYAGSDAIGSETWTPQ